MRLLIDVTDRDIDRGCSDPRGCPVALAATNALVAAGYHEYAWHAEWEPYRAFREPEGFSVRRDGEVVCTVPVHEMPLEAYEFASLYDDWYANKDLDDPDPDAPERPCPFSFEVELDLPTL